MVFRTVRMHVISTWLVGMLVLIGSAGSFGGAAFASTQPAAATTVAPQAEPEWIDGASKQQHGFNCFFNYVEPILVSYAGYYGTKDSSSPAIGDRYMMHIVVAKTGTGCGNAAVTTEAILPAYSRLAIDATHPVRCWAEDVRNNTPRVEVTTDKEWDCVQNPGQGPFTERGWNFGTRVLTTGIIFEVEIPIVTIRPLSNNGICATDSPNLFGGLVYSSVTEPTETIAYQCAWVASKVPSIDYPTGNGANNVGETTAWTAANVHSYYTAGKAFFDLGMTTSYGRSSEPIVIAEDRFEYPDVAIQWTGLTPGTLYHWRLRLVADNGTVYTGEDQTFTTRAASTTTTPVPSPSATTLVPTATTPAASVTPTAIGTTPTPPAYVIYLPYMER